MKKTITILAVIVVCCFQACHKSENIIAPTLPFTTVEDSSLINRADSLERAVLAEIYYTNIRLANAGRVVVKPIKRIEAIRASDAVNQ